MTASKVICKPGSAWQKVNSTRLAQNKGVTSVHPLCTARTPGGAVFLVLREWVNAPSGPILGLVSSF